MPGNIMFSKTVFGKTMFGRSGVGMNRKRVSKWISIFTLVGTGAWLLSLSSCARDQQLIGITVSPSSFTFLSPDPSLVANFSAVGTYIHPAEHKDISALVTWGNNVPQLLNMNQGSVSPTGNGCGVINISASYDKGTGPSGNLVSGGATVIVNDALIPSCPGGSSAPILTVVPQATSSTGDSITSSPAGIDCPAQTCGAPFASGTSVTLTASPSANFVSWGTTCQGAVGNVCVITVTTSTSVTAIFQ
ncbi:MAG: hypothetical protein DMG79_09420 [Acidobacteria bacterium]|nr:MAG: hypothetical protein DMG79_09420 [Acidobacteriota bacterium]